MAEDAAVPSPAARLQRRRLGELLISYGVLTQEQLDDALVRQRAAKGSRLGRILVDLGYATEVQICEAVAEQLRIPAADMVAVDVPADVLGKVTRELAMKYSVLPWFVEGRDLFLIMADPTNISAADAIAFHAGLRIRPVVAPESELLAALERFYAPEEDSLAQFENLELADQLSFVADDAPAEDDSPEAAASTGPIVKLVNAILADAIRAGASDIHIEPQPKGVELRYRVDGLLRRVMEMPKRVQGRLVSRVKIMSHMDISERRKPQDGRTFLRVGSKGYDLRVSSLPTAEGEKLVLRILVQARAQVSLDELGLASETLGQFRDLLSRPQGMILVTGPTGSGKTSTLYAALNHLRNETTNIVTVEDPVEYRLPGISQVAVSEKAGLTFANGLRSILRQDPDVIMVGEIRDAETALISMQAAQTGHLVLSTLHTNDAPGAVTRLLDLGIPAYVVASSVLGVLAQRLVRRVCTCHSVVDGRAVPRGCDACRGSGYAGRLGVHELLRFSPRVRSVVVARGDEDLLRRSARVAGMKTMFEDGLLKAERGQTTVDEVRRVVAPDEAPEPETLPALPPALSTATLERLPPQILIVEDDAGMLEALADTLVAESYRVVRAANGEEAVSLLERETPDLVLTDLQMPGLDGLELLRRLRNDLKTRHVPVVFLTVVDSPDTEMRALDLGADDYLSKPVMRNRLLGRIRRSLVRSRLQRQIA